MNGRRLEPGAVRSALMAALALAACSTVPYTDRKRLMLVPEAQAAELGDAAFRQTLAEARASNDVEKKAMLERVGRNLARAAKTGGLRWEFALLDDPEQVNAFALPGGKVAAYTGLWKVVQDEADLAVVIGHEIAHVLARHGGERMSQMMVAQFGGVALSALLADKPAQAQQLYATAYGAGVTVGALLPFSRLHESEADRIGLSIMAGAGYDPARALPFWQRMSELQAKTQPEPPALLRTHPSGADRIEDIRKHLPEARRRYKPRAP